MSIDTPTRDQVVSSPSGEDTAPVVIVQDGPERAPGVHAKAAPERSTSAGAFVVGVALTILGAFLLCFVAQLTVVGSLQQNRDQQVLFDEFRDQLANGVLPVGQVSDGSLVPVGSPVAQVRIPSLGIDEVVVEGTTSSATMSGPGHRRDTVLPGQAGTSIVAGRQAAFGGPFARIDELKAGDTITVLTAQGEQTFAVTAQRTGTQAAAPLEAGKARLTLVTADGTPFVPEGTLRVDATATSPTQPAPARPLGAASLPGAEDLMKGEPWAWVPLVFWGQALLAAALAVVWASARWGRLHAWLVGVPVLLFLGLSVAHQAARLLPNLT